MTADPVESLLHLRQHQHDGARSPHKPLLALLALGRLARTGSSEISWSEARIDLAALVTDFGPPSKTAATQKAAYPRGALGLTEDYRIQVSTDYTARTAAGRQIYELADREVRPRPGTALPDASHVRWHQTQVFKGLRLTG